MKFFLKKFCVVGALLFFSGCFGLTMTSIQTTQTPLQDFSIFRDSRGVIEHGPQLQKVVALTFDADMTPKMLKALRSGKVKSWYAKGIIDTLEKNNIPATIFLTGMWSETYPEVVQNFASNPLFELEDHSYDHASYYGKCYGLPPATDKKSEITKTQNIVQRLTGAAPKFFRFPGGCYSRDDVKIVQDLGLEVIGWDVVSGDAYLKKPQPIVAQVLKNVTNGSIVVMHLNGGPNAPATADALPGIIAGLQKKGFQFVTVEQLLRN